MGMLVINFGDTGYQFMEYCYLIWKYWWSSISEILVINFGVNCKGPFSKNLARLGAKSKFLSGGLIILSRHMINKNRGAKPADPLSTFFKNL